MLRLLNIENIAVIEKADIAFQPGLNILTGETGAGKSIIIDAISIIIGGRINKDIIRKGAAKGVVTGIFDCTEAVKNWLNDNDFDIDDELVIQRKITSDGKSTCRINGSVAAAAQLKDLSAYTVDIHGQNDGRKLLDEKTHLRYLDSFGKLDSLLEDYTTTYLQYRKTKAELEELENSLESSNELCEVLKARAAELSRAHIQKGEFDALKERRDLLHNSEKLTDSLSAALDILCNSEINIQNLLPDLEYYITKASNYYPALASTAEQASSLSFAVQDIAEQLKDAVSELDFSPEEYDAIETRLSLINRLERKYGKLSDEFEDYEQELTERIQKLDNSDERIDELRHKVREEFQLCTKKADLLSDARKKVSKSLQDRITEELRELSMPSAHFEIAINPVETIDGINSTGRDAVCFLIAANKGESAGKISKVASGGELSRIMLAMKNVFSETESVQAMIFDEIDTGVSGVAAQRVGEKLFNLSSGRQVMCVTHLPQIAVMADTHYKISKEEKAERTYTTVTQLNADGRCRELARLYSGDNITQLTLAGAMEQLEEANHYKQKINNV